MTHHPLHKTRVYTTEQVRELDRMAIQQAGIPGYMLMERAAQAMFGHMLQRWPQATSLCVVCGAGNNGGDGYVIARLALERGWLVTLLAVADPQRLSGDAALACEDYQAQGGAITPFTGILPIADLLVDAVLGTGLTRPVEGVYADVIAQINQYPTPVVSADVPSGLNADTGLPYGLAVQANVTVTFIGLKAGVLTGQARDYTGELVLADLGVPLAVQGLYPEGMPADMSVIPDTLLNRVLSPRARCSHKGHFGHSLLIGGVAGMSGAIRLAGEAALRTGSGLVTVATDPVHAAWINLTRPELMVSGIERAQQLRSVLAGKTCIGIGPGLGQWPWSRGLLTLVLASELPLVLDADALNLLAGMPVRRDNWILTPHPAEAARLLACTTSAVEADRVAAVRRLQVQYGGVVVLKGAGTLVATEDHVAFCTAGNPGMSSAGMGDVLTGIITGLLAQGLSLVDAAQAGVQIHAQAADRAAKGGERGLLAGDVINFIREGVNP